MCENIKPSSLLEQVPKLQIPQQAGRSLHTLICEVFNRILEATSTVLARQAPLDDVRTLLQPFCPQEGVLSIPSCMTALASSQGVHASGPC